MAFIKVAKGEEKWGWQPTIEIKSKIQPIVVVAGKRRETE